MAEALVSRGPDDSGTWADAETGICLGFRRLAIVDVSPCGHQPMLSADGRYVLVFNGEIYNFHELRTELLNAGARFRGTSDTEVILAAVSQWGVAATLPKLWGMFAIALWDRVTRTLVLARDRLGKKPLYFARIGDTLLFGSELKALHRHPAFRPEIDQDAVTLYIRYGYVPTPFSIYRNVSKLVQGTYMTFRDRQAISTHTYWSVLDVAQAGSDAPVQIRDEEAVDQLDALLRDAVRRRMIADVPLGAFLSGGIDSSTVVALMQAMSDRPVKTFTIGFDIPGYNEAESAKAVARAIGTDHTELYVRPQEALDVIPLLPHLYDEPFADSSQIPTFLVSRLARQRVAVALSGDGGDELLSGYTRYTWARNIVKYMRSIPTPLRRTVAGILRAVPASGWDNAYHAVTWAVPRKWRHPTPGDKLHKLAGLVVQGPDELYQRLVSQWKQPADVVLDAYEKAHWVSNQDIHRSARSYVERMMLRDTVAYLPDDILVKVDRASMGVSLEARSPLLDHRVVEWSWRVPLSLKQRGNEGKWVLRQVLYRYLPKALFDRPKMGFGVPIGAWLRGPLREWAEDLLSEQSLRRSGLLRPAVIRQTWQSHLSGAHNEQARLWVVLMFQAWYSTWIG